MLVFNWFAGFVYATQRPPLSPGRILLLRAPLLSLPIIVPIAALIAMLAVAWHRSSDRVRWVPVVFAAGWFLLSLIGVSASGRFYEDYFLQLVPSMVLALTAGLDLLLQPAPEADTVRASTWRRVGLGFACVALISTVVGLGVDYANPPPGNASGPVGGRRLAALTKPGDQVFVWGIAMPILVYADRLPSTVTFSYYPLRFPYPGSTYGSRSDPTVLGVKTATAAEVILGEWTRRLPEAIVLTAPIDDQSASSVESPDDLRVVRRLRVLLATQYTRAAAWTQPHGQPRRILIYLRKR